MKILTIGIPVFNEIRHLEQTISNIFEIASKIDYEIELLIVDNFSTDGSREFLENLESKSSNVDLKVIFNSKNEGFTFSCDTLMNQAAGDYLWIIGGQDKIYLEGLIIAKEVLAYNPNYVICNAQIRDELTDKIINRSLWGPLQSKNFTSLQEFFADMGGPCQAVSCNIYKSSLIKNYTRQKQVTHLWGFIERTMDLLLDKKDDVKIRFIDKPLVEMLIESDGWQIQGVENFGLTPEKTYGVFTPFLQISELYNIKLKSEMQIKKTAAPFRDKFGILRSLVTSKAQGLPVNRKLIIRVCKAFKGSILFWIFGLPILISPQFVSRKLIHTKRLVHLIRSVFGVKTF